MTEQSELQRLSDIAQMAKSEPFRDLKEMLDGLVSEAHEAIVGCIAGDPNVYKTLMIRYQQRLAVKRAIDQWTESAAKAIEENVEAMRQDLERMEAEGAMSR